MNSIPMKKLLFLFAFLAGTSASFAQNYSQQAKTYFNQYLSTQTMTDLIRNSLPTLEDCQLVFKDAYAKQYFDYVEKSKEQMLPGQVKQDEKFVAVGVDVFSTQDIQQKKGNYAGGMNGIADKLQAYVTFYKVELLRTEGADAGVSYNYWVNINGRWVFFPKPWHAFKA